MLVEGEMLCISNGSAVALWITLYMAAKEFAKVQFIVIQI